MKIAILTGGVSSEREVAIKSSENMRNWCQKANHETQIYNLPTEPGTFIMHYREYDLVIPMFHGVYGEDGQITAFLSTLGCRYAYSDFSVHNLCIDKNLTNLLLEKIGIHIPKSIFLKQGENMPELDFSQSYIIKPNHGGSSIATSKVVEQSELINACKAITDDDILIQECIEGREFTVGVYYDTTGYHALPIIEIQTLSHDFFDYSEKYETDGSNEIFIEGEDDLQRLLGEQSIKICKYTGTQGVVRIDWRYDGKDIYFLEVNTIPGFTSGSLVPKMWKKAGKSEVEFIEMLYK